MGKRSVQDGEAALWRLAMRDVAPLRASHAQSSLPPSPAKPDKTLEAHRKKSVQPKALKAFKTTLSVAQERPKRAQELAIGERSPGLDNTQWRRLSRGEMRVEARLDLHGYIVQDAFEALLHFMHRARGMRWRCVEIVTGLGSGARGGTIRRELPLWLQRSDVRPMILAVVHSHNSNRGAVRILLKRRRT